MVRLCLSRPQGKLTGVACHWVRACAGDNGGPDGMVADLAAWGAPAHLIDQVNQVNRLDSEPYLVLKENWPAVRIFLSLQTAWRVGVSGGYLGLDYPSVRVVMEAVGRWPDAEMFLDIQAMEFAALKEMEIVAPK